MTNYQRKSMVLASIIGTLFSCYSESEKTRLHKAVHSRIGKNIRKFAKQFGEDTVKEVVYIDGQSIWKQAVGHFAERKITIEAASCILSLWNLDEKVLSKHYGLGKGVIGKFCKPSRREDRVELENASREVAKYVFNAVNELYGIEVEKKMSVMERLKMMKESV